MSSKVSWRIGFGFALCVAVVVALGVASLASVRRERDASAWVLHSDEVIANLRSVAELLLASETSARGYALAGADAFLAPHATAVRELPGAIAKLRELTSDNPRQQQALAALEPLVAVRLAISDELIGARRSGGQAAAAAIVAGGRGKTATEAARAVLGRMDDEESRLLRERTALAAARGAATAQAIAWTTIFAVAVACAGTILIGRSVVGPVKQLAAGAARLGRGDFGHRVVVERDDELGMLAREFNAMADQLRQMQRDRERALASERFLTDRLEAAAHGSLAIAQATVASPGDRDAVLATVAERARATIDADFAAVGVGTDPARPFAPWVSVGIGSEVTAALARPPRPVGALGAPARRHVIVRCDDLRREPGFGGFPAGHPEMAAFLGVPLRDATADIGTLYLARSPGREPFRKSDELAISLLAASAALSIENAHLYGQLAAERGRLRILSDAGVALAGSLDYAQTLARVVDLAVKEIGDECLLAVRDGEGRLRLAAVAAADPAREEAIRDGFRHGAPPVDRALARALATGRSEIVGADDLADAEHAARSGALPPSMATLRSAMCLPLAARDRTLGVMCIGATRRTAYDADDLPLGEEIARRAALSMENARLYEEARDAVRVREDVLAIVSHDMRNPVTAIRATADTMLRMAARAAPDPKLVDGLARIRRAVGRIEALIRDLLDAASIDAGRLSVDRAWEDGAEILADAASEVAAAADERGIHVETVVGEDVAVVLCDRQRVVQALGNLAGNALKFTPGGGTITLSVQRAGDRVVYAVADRGPGIAPDDVPRLFDRYWRPERAAGRGTGLGLFIVKGIVESHGGRVWVESELGRGTTFFFSLPVHEPAPAHADG